MSHVEERIARIEEIVSEGQAAFMSSHILQDAVIRNFEVIGEAARQRILPFRGGGSSVQGPARSGSL